MTLTASDHLISVVNYVAAVCDTAVHYRFPAAKVLLAWLGGLDALLLAMGTDDIIPIDSVPIHTLAIHHLGPCTGTTFFCFERTVFPHLIKLKGVCLLI